MRTWPFAGVSHPWRSAPVNQSLKEDISADAGVRERLGRFRSLPKNWRVGSFLFTVFLARTRQPDSGEHVLGHPTRRAMYEDILARPGVTLGDLRKRVHLGWGNAYHHLRKLERAGLVRSERLGRRLVVSPSGREYDRQRAVAVAYLKGAAAFAICLDIMEHAGTSVVAIAERQRLSVRSVYYHVERLAQLGLVASRSSTRQFALHPEPLLLNVLSETGWDPHP